MHDTLAITIPTLAIIVSVLLNRADATKLGDRLESRIIHLETKFEDRITHLETKFEDRITHLEARFEARLDRVDSRLDTQSADIANIRERLTRMEERSATRAAS